MHHSAGLCIEYDLLKNLISFILLRGEEGTHSCARKTLQCDPPDEIKIVIKPPFPFSRLENCRGTSLVGNTPSTASLAGLILDN
jgi:hypothetical protein